MSKTVYMFSSPTCPPCNHIKPFINELKEDYSSFEWIDVNIKDDPQNIRGRYDVQTVPTMVTVKEGVAIGKSNGTNAMGYLRILKQLQQ
jgi:thioredoxin-like negative regulator of GroEL